MKRVVFSIIVMVCFAGCGLYTACKNDCPSQPPVLLPGHTALALTPVQVSTRWLTLQWKNDSAAVSRAYVLLRNGKDTIYNAAANAADTIVVKDSGLTPSTTYNYSLYRIYQNEHWDSATAAVHTLDTTKDQYSFTVTKFNQAILFAVWGASPNSVWAGGGLDSGDILHYYNGQFQQIDAKIFTVYSITGTSDSDIWFGGNGLLAHWNGKTFKQYVFRGDTMPDILQNFTGIWIAPDSEIFFACSGGAIVHRSASGKWDTMASGTKLGLFSIIGFAPNDVYAAGGYSNFEGVLLHYDGSSWSTVLQSVLPNSPVKVGNMVVGGDSPDSLWLVGNGVFHKKGNMWENRTPADESGYAYSVHSQDWNNVFVAGDYGTLLKFGGDHWVAYDLVAHANGTSLNSVTNFTNDVFAVGDDNNYGYFIHGQ